jgi:SAM-dependent methyltransferase
MSDDFYRAFEERHRGSREAIMQRLRIYLPFVLPVAHAHPDAVCLDLGCGRGEWLQLLGEHGLAAEGVDLDAGMLEAARAQGLRVRQADAIGVLQELPEAQLAVVSAFHLAEHLPFEDLKTLVAQACRVLMPGGLLILETPNPDNLQVATSNFYLDPSHRKPIPAALLAFLTEHAGFARSKVLGLQQSPGLRFKSDLNLQDVLGGASPDYAVIALKKGPQAIFERLDAPLERTYGVSTAQLAQTYSAQQVRGLREIRLDMHALQTQLQQALEQISLLQMQRSQLATELQEIRSSSLWQVEGALQWIRDQHQRWRQQGLRSRLLALMRKTIRRLTGASGKKPDHPSD